MYVTTLWPRVPGSYCMYVYREALSGRCSLIARFRNLLAVSGE